MFGFPKADSSLKNNFKHNFLRNVVFYVGFDSTDILFQNKTKIQSIFQEKYPRLNDNPSNNYEIQINKSETPIISSTKGKGFTLKTLNGDNSLIFLSDRIELNIQGKGYKNFEEIANFELIKIQEVLLNYNINIVTRIAIRKINILGLHVQPGANLTQISKDLINESISASFGIYPLEEFIQQNISQVNYVNKNDGLNLKIGHVLQFDSIGHFICDIDRYNTFSSHSKDLNTLFKSMNDEVFDVFIWFLNRHTLNMLAI